MERTIVTATLEETLKDFIIAKTEKNNVLIKVSENADATLSQLTTKVGVIRTDL